MYLYFLLFLCCFPRLFWAQSSDSTIKFAEWDSLGHEFVQLLNEQDKDMDYYFAPRAFWKRLIINNPRNTNIRQLNRDLLDQAEDFQISDVFLQGGEGVYYKYLHSQADSVLVVQQQVGEVELSYLLFKVDYFGREWKVVDVYFLIYESYLSTLIKNTIYFPIVFEALERENASLILENSKIYRESKHLYGEGEYEQAYLKISGIPLEERLKEYQVYKIFLATKLEEEHKFLRSVQEYQEHYKSEESLPLLLLDYYILTEAYEEALKAIEEINTKVGGDTYLDFYRAMVYYLKGDWKKSAALLEGILPAYPEEEYYVGLLLDILTERKAYKRAVKVLNQQVAAGILEDWQLSSWIKMNYPYFAKSGPFKKWDRKR